jgi:hypothetical protein
MTRKWRTRSKNVRTCGDYRIEREAPPTNVTPRPKARWILMCRGRWLVGETFSSYCDTLTEAKALAGALMAADDTATERLAALTDVQRRVLTECVEHEQRSEEIQKLWRGAYAPGRRARYARELASMGYCSVHEGSKGSLDRTTVAMFLNHAGWRLIECGAEIDLVGRHD